MIFNSTIKRFNLMEVQKMFNEGNSQEFSTLMETLINRNVPQKSTNLDRRLIHYWESRGLFNEVSDNGYLSFFDICWLNVLQELKELGVTPKIMSEVYNFFFGDNTFLETLFTKPNIDKVDFRSEELEQLSKKEDIVQMLRNNGWNNFSMSIMSVLLTRKNTCLHVSAGGKVAGFDVPSLIDTESPINSLNVFFNTSFISISLYNIVNRIVDDNETFSLNDNELLIKESSINIIKKMFNDNTIQKITFRLNDKRTPIIEVTKRLDFSEFYNKIHYLKKKGTFIDMKIKTRDGNVQLFEVTELINTK
jgi:DNA-binding transcriptional MerR regulator